MNFCRRTFLRLAAGTAVLPAIPRDTLAQAYPNRPVHVVIGFAPGNTADILTRLLTERLSKRLDQQFVIEYRPGVATNIATEAVAKSPPDGYTLLWITTANTINATLYKKLNFDFLRDIVPVASVTRTSCVLVANPAFPAKTVPDLIAYAKANPGKVNIATGGIGTSDYLLGVLFMMMTGIKLVHVSYHGEGPALTDLIAGQVQVMFALAPGVIQAIRSGQLRPLAVSTAARVEALPDVPTVGEFVPGFEGSSWQGIGAPAHTPAEIVDTLNREINAGLADSAIKTRLVDLGSVPFPNSPADLEKFVIAETQKWAKVIAFSGAKLD